MSPLTSAPCRPWQEVLKAAAMTKVDCEDCYEKFTTKKLYINHVKSKTCSKAKLKTASKARLTPSPSLAKRARVEADPLAMAGREGEGLAALAGREGEGAQFASPRRLEELQGQIKNLTEEQKRALQEQITRKQRQVGHTRKYVVFVAVIPPAARSSSCAAAAYTARAARSVRQSCPSCPKCAAELPEVCSKCARSALGAAGASPGARARREAMKTN